MCSPWLEDMVCDCVSWPTGTVLGKTGELYDCQFYESVVPLPHVRVCPFPCYSVTAPTSCCSVHLTAMTRAASMFLCLPVSCLSGEEGKVDEAQKLMEEADVLRKVRGTGGWVET